MAELDDANPLQVEIMAERASAYFSTTRKLEAALRALAEFDKTCDRGHLAPADQHRRRELFLEAAEQTWVFVIQREAMKLPYYDELFADFGIPEEVRKQMGPKLSADGKPFALVVELPGSKTSAQL